LTQGTLQFPGEIQWGNGIDFKYLTVEIRIGLFDGNVWGVSGVVDDRSDAVGPLGQLGPKSLRRKVPRKGTNRFRERSQPVTLATSRINLKMIREFGHQRLSNAARSTRNQN
jgi:hypothetical protein